MSNSKSKSVLGMAAEIAAKDGDDQPLVPWWKVPKKLVDAVLNDDTDRRNALIAGLVDLAAKDERFRRQMLSKFQALGAGKKTPVGHPLWVKVMLVYHVEFFREHLKQGNKPHSIPKVCTAISHHFDLPPERVEKLYYQWRGNPNVKKLLQQITINRE